MREELLETLKEIQNVKEKIEEMEKNLENLINNEDFMRFFHKDEIQKRRRRKYNQKYYQKNK